MILDHNWYDHHVDITKKALIITKLIENKFGIKIPSALRSAPNGPAEQAVLIEAMGVATWSLTACPLKSYSPEFNMEPENHPLEKETPIGNHHFQVPC